MAVVALALLTLIVCCLHSQQVAASGTLQFQLRRFENFQSVLASGECCAGGERVRGMCAGSCYTVFFVCLTHYKTYSSGNDMSCQPFGLHNITQHVSDGSSFTLDRQHTISVPFDFRWPGSFGAFIQAFNQRPTGDSDVIMTLPWQALVGVSEAWHEEVFSERSLRLEFAYRVTCKPSYYGSDCNKECVGRDDSNGHYTCNSQGEFVCLPGWTGSPYCTEAICNPPCGKGGRCTAPNTCSCKELWQGQTCDQCQTVRGCVHGYCRKAGDCLCNPGWGGINCDRDLNFCTSREPCRNGGTCINVNGGYYKCQCPPGYTGFNCEVKQGMCREQHCHNGGTCTDNFVCQCPRGFHGNLCEFVASDCSDQPCHNGARCESSEAGYKCTCLEGYSGVNCELPSMPCLSSPCANGGKCIQNGTSFYCQCAYGFSGDLCNTDIDDCHMSPCLNGGTCKDQPDGYQCLCRVGYGGRLCEETVGCEASPCANGGHCQKLKEGGLQCICLPGYTGGDCSSRVETCASRPCLNGATCTDGPREYECTCAVDFTGRQCENPIVVIDMSTQEEGVLDLRQLLLILGLGAGLPLIIICLIMVVMVHQRRRLLRAIEMQSHNLRMGIENDSNEQHQQAMNNRPPVKKIFNDLGGSGGRTGSSSSAGSSKSLLGSSSRCADIHKGGTLLASYTRSQSHHALQQHENDDCCQKSSWAANAGCCSTIDGGVKLRSDRKYGVADEVRAERRRSKLSTFEVNGTLRQHVAGSKKVDNLTSKNINTDTDTLKGIDQKASLRTRDSVFCSSSDDASCTEQLLLASPDSGACQYHLVVDSLDDALDAEQPGGVNSVLLNPQYWLAAASRPPPPTLAPPPASTGAAPPPDTSVFVVDANRGCRQYRSVVLATEV